MYKLSIKWEIDTNFVSSLKWEIQTNTYIQTLS